MTEIAVQLQNGREHLRANGWLQGDFGGPVGPSCIMGALAYGNGMKPTYTMDEEHPLHQAWSALEQAAVGRIPTTHRRSRSNTVVEYNNAIAASLDDAVELFDEAIARIESR